MSEKLKAIWPAGSKCGETVVCADGPAWNSEAAVHHALMSGRGHGLRNGRSYPLAPTAFADKLKHLKENKE